MAGKAFRAADNSWRRDWFSFFKAKFSVLSAFTSASNLTIRAWRSVSSAQTVLVRMSPMTASENRRGNSFDGRILMKLGYQNGRIVARRIKCAPAAARYRALWSGFVRFSEEPSDRDLQTASQGDDFIIHEVARLIFNPRNRGLVHRNPSGGHPAGEVVLGHSRLALQASLSHPSPDNVPLLRLPGFLHQACGMHMLDL